jgi:hypothetical protein
MVPCTLSPTGYSGQLNPATAQRSLRGGTPTRRLGLCAGRSASDNTATLIVLAPRRPMAAHESPRTTEARFRARSATSADSPYARAYGRVVAGSKTGRSAETAKEFLVEAAGGLLNCDRREKRVFQYYRPVADLRDRSYERAGMARKRSLAAGANHVRQRARDAQRVGGDRETNAPISARSPTDPRPSKAASLRHPRSVARHRKPQ